MNPLALIEKVINEHGSSTILKERLAAIKDELSKVIAERDDYKNQLSELKAEVYDLRKKVEHQSRKDEFTEHRGALFKKKASGSYQDAVYCPICHGAMSSLEKVLPYNCSRDGQTVDFKGTDLPKILRELESGDI